jgi:hypothetical protein
MTCDDGMYYIFVCFNVFSCLNLRYLLLLITLLGRPCQRCIKRSIGHLCHDEPKGSHGVQQMSSGHNTLPAGILAMQSLPQEGKYLHYV